MRLKHAFIAAAIVASLGAFAPSAMGAARVTGSSTAAGQNFEGLNAGSAAGVHTFRINSNYSVRCNTARFAGTTPTLPNVSISFQPTFSGCALNAAGTLYASTVTCGTWTLNGSAATYNGTSFATTGLRISTSGNCVITVTGAGCSVTVPPVTVSTGITAQNRNSTDTADAATGGSRVRGTNAGPIAGTSSGCSTLGVPASFSAGDYSGAVQIIPHTTSGVNYVGLWAIT